MAKTLELSDLLHCRRWRKDWNLEKFILMEFLIEFPEESSRSSPSICNFRLNFHGAAQIFMESYSKILIHFLKSKGLSLSELKKDRIRMNTTNNFNTYEYRLVTCNTTRYLNQKS